MESKEKSTIVIGVIGADCHAVGNQVLQFFFREAGFKVVNLGVMVSQDEFIDAAIETGADAILVSSLYGHGEIDCIGFRERCVERGIESIVLYVGGNLVIGKHDFQEIETRFKEMGFDRAFHADVDLKKAACLLREDIAERKKKKQPRLIQGHKKHNRPKIGQEAKQEAKHKANQKAGQKAMEKTVQS